jgi:hypothetical protein
MSSQQKARQRMDGAIEALRREFAGVRTGKASPALLDTIRVEAYGSMVPLNQVGTVAFMRFLSHGCTVSMRASGAATVPTWFRGTMLP